MFLNVLCDSHRSSRSSLPAAVYQLYQRGYGMGVVRNYSRVERASPLFFRRTREKVALIHRKYRIYQVES
eukprot:scaffold16761_cov32-Cyclotella_meneghiniana.AAC.1